MRPLYDKVCRLRPRREGQPLQGVEVRRLPVAWPEADYVRVVLELVPRERAWPRRVVALDEGDKVPVPF